MSLDINKNEGVAEMTLGQLKQLCFWRVLDLASGNTSFFTSFSVRLVHQDDISKILSKILPSHSGPEVSVNLSEH